MKLLGEEDKPIENKPTKKKLTESCEKSCYFLKTLTML
jgi:hypothetical protein